MSADDKSHYLPCPNMAYQCLTMGADQQELVRVDNYIQGADFLRQDAISRNNFAVADSFYPGVRMAISDAYIIALVKKAPVASRNNF